MNISLKTKISWGDVSDISMVYIFGWFTAYFTKCFTFNFVDPSTFPIPMAVMAFCVCPAFFGVGLVFMCMNNKWFINLKATDESIS